MYKDWFYKSTPINNKALEGCLVGSACVTLNLGVGDLSLTLGVVIIQKNKILKKTKALETLIKFRCTTDCSITLKESAL